MDVEKEIKTIEEDIGRKETTIWEHAICSELCFRNKAVSRQQVKCATWIICIIYIATLTIESFRSGIYRALNIAFPGNENKIKDSLKNIQKLEPDHDYSKNMSKILTNLNNRVERKKIEPI